MTAPRLRDPFWEQLLRRLRPQRDPGVTLGPTEAVGYYASPELAAKVDPIQLGLRLAQRQDNAPAMARSQAAMQESRGLLPTAAHLLADAGAGVPFLVPGADDPKEMAALRLQRLLGRPADENPSAMRTLAAGMVGWPSAPTANRELTPEEQEQVRRLQAVIADPNVQGAQSRLDEYAMAGGNVNAPLLPEALDNLLRARPGDSFTPASVFGASAATGAVGANLGLNAAIPNVGSLEAGMSIPQAAGAMLRAGAVEGGTGALMAYAAAIGQGATPEEAMAVARHEGLIQGGLGLAFRGLHGGGAAREMVRNLPPLRETGRNLWDSAEEFLTGGPSGMNPHQEHQTFLDNGQIPPRRLRRLMDEQDARVNAEEAAMGISRPEPQEGGWFPDLASQRGAVGAEGPQRQERIVGAAVRTPEGEVFQGAAHFEAAEAAGRASESPQYHQLEHGFVTDRGRFVNRVEAQDIARVTSQTSRRDARGLDTSEFIRDRTPEEQAADPNPISLEPQTFHDHFFGPQRTGEEGMIGTYGLRSRLPKSIQAAKLEKAPAQTWVSKLRGAGNNASEFDWVVGEVLRRDPKRVWTRQQLLDLAEGRGIKIEERVLGEEQYHKGEPVNDFDGRPKFNDPRYIIPGGTNYREVLVKLEGPEPRQPRDEAVLRDEEAKVWAEIEAKPDFPGEGHPMRNHLMQWATDNYPELAQRYQRIRDEMNGRGDFDPNKDAFQSQHWDDPNVLVHLRMNDRIGPNGEKILFIEEVQSDWMQKGRKEGFAPSNPGPRVATSARPTYEGKMWEVRDQNGEFIVNVSRDVFPTEAQAFEQANLRVRDGTDAPRGGAVPDAPGMFKETPGWTLLGLKRALDEAVAGGYDRMAWTTGAQQAERYDLSKVVDEVQYDPDSRTLITFGEGGRQHFNDVPPEKLADYIGKEGAERLLATTPEQSHAVAFEVLQDGRPIADFDTKAEAEAFVGTRARQAAIPLGDFSVRPNRGTTHVLRGADLKVGGEGMHGYYDQILPDALKAYGKKLGVKLEVEPPAARRTVEEIDRDLDLLTEEGEGMGIGSETGQAMYDALMEERNRAGGFTDDMAAQPSIRITPELRSKIQGGQELGQGAPAMMGGMAGGIGGAAYGATQGDTPEERLRNAALYGLGGLAGGVGLGRLAENAPLARLFGDVEEGFPSLPRGEVRGLLDELGKIGVSHGTPHQFPPEEGAPFGRFRMDKIGTGEGNQSYGYGHYLAGADAVSEHYRDKLTQGRYRVADGSAFDADDLGHLNVRVIARRDGIEAALDEARRLAESPTQQQNARTLAHDIGLLEDVQRRGGATRETGNVYHADIDAEPEHFLDWDKPLSEQSDYVRERMNRLIPGMEEVGLQPLTGGAMYDYLSAIHRSPAKASAVLREAGIPGNRYLDGSSRRAGEGSHNYVVFDDAKLKVTGRNGSPLPDLGNERGALGRQPKGPVTKTKAFRQFFGKSKVVNEAGQPKVLYHGTTADFDTFDLSRANAESDWGKAIYLSDNTDEVSANYAGLGPDLTNKIERRAEQIEQERGISYQEAKEVAREEFGSHEGAAMPVYVKMENPVVVGGRDQTRLDYTVETDENGDYTGEEGGKFIELVDALRHNASQYDDGDVEELISELAQQAMDYEGITAEDLYRIARGNEQFQYFTDDTGNLVANEILRKSLEDIGFDGIIDRTVDYKFGSGREFGRPMAGLDENTAHYIAFRPEQIKSATGNRGTFDPTSANITLGLGALAAGSQMMQSEEDEPLPSRVQSLLRPR